MTIAPPPFTPALAVETTRARAAEAGLQVYVDAMLGTITPVPAPPPSSVQILSPAAGTTVASGTIAIVVQSNLVAVQIQDHLGGALAQGTVGANHLVVFNVDSARIGSGATQLRAVAFDAPVGDPFTVSAATLVDIIVPIVVVIPGTPSPSPTPAPTPGPIGFTPASVVGLELWWDFADGATVSIISGKVSQIADKKNAHDAVQATPGLRPTYMTNVGAFNNLSVGDWNAAFAIALVAPHAAGIDDFWAGNSFRSFHNCATKSGNTVTNPWTLIRSALTQGSYQGAGDQSLAPFIYAELWEPGDGRGDHFTVYVDQVEVWDGYYPWAHPDGTAAGPGEFIADHAFGDNWAGRLGACSDPTVLPSDFKLFYFRQFTK